MTTAPAADTASKPLYASLFVQVLAVLGIVLGMAVPDFAISLKILSDAFLKLISMIVAPIVFCVVVHGTSCRSRGSRGRTAFCEMPFPSRSTTDASASFQ
jgi:Na+/H+-dicarboxylate symporter